MKTKSILTVIAITGAALIFASCSETINGVEDMLASAEVKSSETEAYYGDSCTFSGVLTEAEIDGLMEMREEEKLAHDVYTFFYEKYNYLIFNNISKSEQAHSNAVSKLINGYGLEDPALTEPGKFTNPDFNDLYTTLTEQGSESLEAALKVGAFIEEYDINDLQNLLEETQNEDVTRVYSNLLRGSKNHIRAFTNVLSRLGEAYTPTVISADEYQDIIENSSTSDSDWTPGYYYNSGDSTNCDGTGPNF